MSAGYGRGYYGKEQLTKPIRRRGGGGWFKVALVVGAGAVIWLMWPRKTVPAGVPGHDGVNPQPLPAPAQDSQIMQATPVAALPVPVAPALPAPVAAPLQASVAVHPQIAAPLPSLMALPAPSAAARGYASTKEYEDAVVASAKQLQDSGAKVVLAPHFAHLAPRLQS